ncbi:MAG: hypothetical protein LBQ66_03165 [Planctomycetaceae bacterium]|nr:hypothetical protein [Planctomycetaceae bacterium]
MNFLISKPTALRRAGICCHFRAMDIGKTIPTALRWAGICCPFKAMDIGKIVTRRVAAG